MPVTLTTHLQSLDQDAFKKLDYQVMHQAFQCQNLLGRLCDESIYQNDLAARLRAMGFTAQTEVPVTVSHRGFSKRYCLDLVVDHGAVYELKAVASLASQHEAQLLNYLFLCGSHHGKLLNFRPAKVESKFINATQTLEERRRFKVDAGRWHQQEESDRLFFTTMLELLEDWGSGLELPLYLEALCFFLGGEERVNRPVPLSRDGVSLGNQWLHLLSPQTAFCLTAMTEAKADYEENLSALLSLSPVKTIQWANLDRHRIEFISLSK